MKPSIHTSAKQAGSTTPERDVPPSSSNYHAFLVRLWRDGSQAAWRASVQDAVTSQRQTFSTVEGLISFLLDQANMPGDPTPAKESKL